MAAFLAPGRAVGAGHPAERGLGRLAAPALLDRPAVCPAGITVAGAALVSVAAALGLSSRRRPGWLRKQQRPHRLAVTRFAAKRGRPKSKDDASEDEPEEGDVQKRREKFRKHMDKKFGQGTMVSMDKVTMDVPTFSTGALTVDLALGGGLPYGRIIEIYGPEQSGKTTLSLSCIASIQATGGLCAFIDAECAMSLDYARNVGVNGDMLEFMNPSSAEAATDMAIEAAESGIFALIVIDSVAALTPLEEMEKGMDGHSIALLPRILAKFLRKITSTLAATKTTLILINQLRANIGGYGPTEITTGGKAIPYYASVRMSIRSPRSGLQGTAEEPTGIVSVVTVSKNKLAAPHRKGEFTIVFNKGISWASSVVEAAVKCGVITKKGSWLSWKDRQEQGVPRFTAMLEQDPEALTRIEKAVRKKAAGISSEDEAEDSEGEAEDSEGGAEDFGGEAEDFGGEAKDS